MSSISNRRNSFLPIASLMLLVAAVLSTPTAAAHHDVDEGGGYYLQAILDTPTATSGTWRVESSGGHEDEAWLRLSSRKGHAEFNFGPQNINGQALQCFVPDAMSGRQVAYRIGDDNYAVPESIYTVPDGGGWLNIVVEKASTQYDFVVTALGVDAQGRSFAAAANTCRILGNYGNISGGTHIPWTPTEGGVAVKDQVLEFWWDTADDEGIGGHIVRLAGDQNGPQLCRGITGVAPFSPPSVQPVYETSCQVEISKVLEEADAREFTGLTFEISSTHFNGRYSSESLPLSVGPINVPKEQEQVTNLIATQHGHGEVAIDWKVDGEHEQSSHGFSVTVLELPESERSAGQSHCPELEEPVADLVGTTCRLTGLEADTRYEVSVAGQGSTRSLKFRTPALPARAANASAIGAVSSVVVDWEYPGGAATKYVVWLAEPGLPTCEVATKTDGSAGKGSCGIEGLRSAATYEIHIFGEDVFGQRSGDVVLSVTTATVEVRMPCDDDGDHTIDKKKAIRKANRKYSKAIEKLADRFEDRPNKLAKKIKQQKKKRSLRIAKAEAVYLARCG